ncbi:unnamed protein product [Musa banksii]
MAWKFFVGGDWNFNGTSEEVKKIVSTLNDRKVASTDVVDVVVSPPYVFLRIVKSLLRPDFHVAAQNCWTESRKGWSGYELLLLGESNEFVGDKVAYALSKGIKVIGCVGETLQCESGATMDVSCTNKNYCMLYYFRFGQLELRRLLHQLGGQL